MAISAAQQDEAEPCGPILASDLDVKRCNERKFQKLVGNSNPYLVCRYILQCRQY